MRWKRTVGMIASLVPLFILISAEGSTVSQVIIVRTLPSVLPPTSPVKTVAKEPNHDVGKRQKSYYRRVGTGDPTKLRTKDRTRAQAQLEASKRETWGIVEVDSNMIRNRHLSFSNKKRGKACTVLRMTRCRGNEALPEGL